VQTCAAPNGIIRNKLNKLKINAVITNSRIVLSYGSLSDYIRNRIDGKPVINAWERQEQMSAASPLSDGVGKDMKRFGFKFVGNTIIYGWLQANGVFQMRLLAAPLIGNRDSYA
jgi:DNA-3-methyladenine glycosylase I